MRLTSFLISIVMTAIVSAAGPLAATGLYDDLPSFFSRGDSLRTLVFRQTECNLRASRASLLTGSFGLRPSPRCDVLLEAQFPVMQGGSGTSYGLGDILVRGSVRLQGDTLNISGLFFRANLRVPSGSKELLPFSNGALQGEAGIEARFIRHGIAVQAAAFYTLAGESVRRADFADDRHATFAASAGLSVPRAGSVRAAAFLVSFPEGDTRNIYVLSLDRDLSPQIALEIAGEVEAGSAWARIFDSTVSVGFTYRLPKRPPLPKSVPGEAPPAPDTNHP